MRRHTGQITYIKYNKDGSSLLASKSGSLSHALCPGLRGQPIAAH